MHDSEEEWKPVLNTGGQYEVSRSGNVRSIKRGVLKLLKPTPLRRRGGVSYPRITIHLNGGRTMRFVHDIVAETFLGPRPPFMQINHKDRNRLNPAADNLEYLSARQNQIHAFLTTNRPRKLSHEEVIEIRSLKPYLTQISIARMFGVSRTLVGDIHKGKVWQYLFDEHAERRRVEESDVVGEEVIANSIAA